MTILATNPDSLVLAHKRHGRKSLADICRYGIPGYDAWDTAGDCYFDAAAAKLAIDFFPECLKHVKSSDATKKGDAFKLDEWEKAIVGNLFGWKRQDGTRRYRKAFIIVGRKNGKSTISAGINLYLFLCDAEGGAEIYCVAKDKEQAGIVFGIAKQMVRLEPELSRRCKVYVDSMVSDGGNCIFRPVTSDASTKFGFNAHGATIDELHTFTDRELLEAWETSTAARRQPLIVYLTTAGKTVSGVGYDEYLYAKQVRDGVVDNNEYLPVIYEAGMEDDWTLEDTWKKANPGLGHSVKLSYLRSACKKAIAQPSNEAGFRRLHLNQWMSEEKPIPWLTPESWSACPSIPNKQDLMGRVCYGGLDLSCTTALTSLGLIFPLGDHIAHLSFNFMPRGQIEKATRRDKIDYALWVRQGWLELTEGKAIDYEFVRRRINEIRKLYNLVEIGVDRWNASDIIGKLQSDGLKVEGFGQGFKDMATPTKELERYVLSGLLSHDGNPIMRWAIDNVNLETDAAGNVKANKKRSSGHIDPVISAIMALGRMIITLPKVSVYETRGVITI